MDTPPKPALYHVVYNNTTIFNALTAKHGEDGFDPGDCIEIADAKTLSGAKTVAKRLRREGHAPLQIERIIDLRLEQHYGDDGCSWRWDDTEIVVEF